MPPTSFLLLLAALLATLSSAAARQPLDIYEVLKYYGFPPGLVPKNTVTGFEINPNSGQFTVHLNASCRFKAYSYDIQMKTQISGVISHDEIKSLHGAQVKIIGFWFDINEVEMIEEGEEIEFKAGRTSADLPTHYFVNIPQCGCGFDCGHTTLAGDSTSDGRRWYYTIAFVITILHSPFSKSSEEIRVSKNHGHYQSVEESSRNCVRCRFELPLHLTEPLRIEFHISITSSPKHHHRNGARLLNLFSCSHSGKVLIKTMLQTSNVEVVSSPAK